MAFKFITPRVGAQPIAETSTVKKHVLGEIQQAADETLGAGEFIYLQGIGSTLVGSVVTYTASFVTALASIAVKIPRPLAVAMSANVASQYGWYQISGLATVRKASATSFAAAAAFGATSGLAVAAVSALVVQNALVATAGASGTTSVLAMINRPGGPIN